MGNRFHVQNNVQSGNVNSVVGDVSGGNVNVGGTGSQSASAAIDELRQAIEALKPHLDGPDQRELDESMRHIDPSRDETELRPPLRKIAGLAALVEKGGAPVIQAVRAVQNALAG